MSPHDYDAILIGAGPAGTVLALRLAAGGRRCLLVDGARFPRDKVCGEGVMPAGLGVLEELGLRASVAEHGQPFHGIRYRLPDGTAAEACFPGGRAGLGIARRHLDAQLVGAAQRHPGVDVRLGTWVRALRRDARGVEVVLGQERLRAQVLVGADGGRSLVRRWAGLEARPPRWARFGVGGHFQHPPFSDPQPLVEVFVGRGYELYTTPVAPDITCAALLLDRAGLEPLRGRLEHGLRELLGASGARCAQLARGPRVGAAVKALGPLGVQARAAHAERVLLVGDAAGALDPITGEGISLGLVTSALAAEVLEGCFRSGDFGRRRLARWTRLRRAEVRGLAGLTRVLLHVAERPGLAARVVRNLAAAPDTFHRLLGVAAGMSPVSALGVRDGVKLLLGV